MNEEHEPWREYLEEFRARAGRIPADAFDRSALLFEAAHDAYQHTTDRLTTAGWDAERALMVARLFGAVVKDWVGNGNNDIDQLETRLRSNYQQWNGL